MENEGISDALGRNDEYGNIECCVCGWKGGPFKTIEQIEWYLGQHLLKAHGLTMDERHDEDGNVVEIPR